jgi:hypothetical protein
MKLVRVAVSSVAILASIVLFQNCGKGFSSKVADQVVLESASSAPPAVPVFQAATFIGPPRALSNGSAFGFDFRANPSAGATVVSTDCQIDAQPAFSCTSPELVRAIPDGPHTFTVFVTYSDGRTLESSHRWSIDRAAPIITSANPPAARNSLTSVEIPFSVVEVNSSNTAQCSLDGAAFASCASPVALTALAIGAHRFVVRSIDLAGNVGTLNIGWITEPMASNKADSKDGSE